MYLPVLQAINTSEIYISGDVTIDSTAVIAPGVILQAAPGSKIIIRAGACIGLGAILKAYGGKIEVKENAILGAGVLVIGESKINAQVCVGNSTTIYNTSLESMTIVPAGSVLGDPTRSQASCYSAKEQNLAPKETLKTENVALPNQQDLQRKEDGKTILKKEEVITPKIKEEETILQEEILVTETTEINSNVEEKWQVTKPRSNTVTEDPWENIPVNNAQNPIVGKVYINKLLVTLFPEKQLKNN